LAPAVDARQAFLSHSWHDDPTEKWSLLQAWRGRFVHAHGREPTIWFDRCCLDPTDLNALLPCLPIFLAGCDTLLALRGSTYLNRLWCGHVRVAPALRLSSLAAREYSELATH
jgi:hypothetical protein